MFRSVSYAIIACAVLLIAEATTAFAATPRQAPSTTTDGWQEILTLAPGQTEASTTRPMRADACAAALAAHPGRSKADCVTHYTLHVVRDAEAKVGLGSPAASNLATYYCNVTVYGYAYNVGWGASVSQRFCVWPYVYVYPAGTQCNNWWAVWPFSLHVTWCGGGRSGWVADGGENLTISSPYLSYGAGQRVSLTANYVAGWSCWNAFC